MPTLLQFRNTDAEGIIGAIYAGDYGVAGDGSSDDGPSIQHALRAAATIGGGHVLLPAGATCKVRNPPIRIYSNVYLVIPISTTIRLDEVEGTYGNVIENADQSATGNTNCGVVGGGTIDGRRTGFTAGDCDGIYFRNVTRAYIGGVRCTANRQNGIRLYNCESAIVERVRCDDNGLHGIRLDYCQWVQLIAPLCGDNCRIATAQTGDGISLGLWSRDCAILAPVCYDSFGGGKLQGYGVREAASSLCDRNLVAGGALNDSATALLFDGAQSQALTLATNNEAGGRTVNP